MVGDALAGRGGAGGVELDGVALAVGDSEGAGVEALLLGHGKNGGAVQTAAKKNHTFTHVGLFCCSLRLNGVKAIDENAEDGGVVRAAVLQGEADEEPGELGRP